MCIYIYIYISIHDSNPNNLHFNNNFCRRRPAKDACAEAGGQLAQEVEAALEHN